MHFREASTGVETLEALLLTSVKIGMWQYTGTGEHIESFDCTPLDGSSNTSHTPTGLTADWTGSISVADITPQVAVLVKSVTAVRGRSHRGRSFLPWCAESVNTAGTLSESTRASMEVAWNLFRTTMATGGWAPVVASYKLAEATDITNYHVEPITATQRRRLKR